MRILVTNTSTLLKNTESALLSPLKASIKDVTKVCMKAAQKDYMKKRISNETPSKVFGSFYYEIGKSSKIIRGVVFAGGNNAPHAQYTNYDRKLRNGKMWSDVNPNAPYMYMLTGREAGRAVYVENIKKHILKMKSVISVT